METIVVRDTGPLGQRGLELRGTGGGVCDADEVGEGFAGAARMSALLGGGGGAFLRWA